MLARFLLREQLRYASPAFEHSKHHDRNFNNFLLPAISEEGCWRSTWIFSQGANWYNLNSLPTCKNASKASRQASFRGISYPVRQYTGAEQPAQLLCGLTSGLTRVASKQASERIASEQVD